MDIKKELARFPRSQLMNGLTPVEPLERLSELLDIELWIKRDDLSGLGFGGNKNRQLEFYFGDAKAQNADTILITGAVQSNYVRSAAAAAARLGLRAILQLEERVPDMGEPYYQSGNVLLSQILGAEQISFPRGEDENGADAALFDRAQKEISEGFKPYIIHLGVNHPPLGALGYVACANELCDQIGAFDAVIAPSGSGSTHSGLLMGLHMIDRAALVFGICVRRPQNQQRIRLKTVLTKLADLLNVDLTTLPENINLWDGALAPGYGRLSASTQDALKLMARTEGIFLDPVYSAKTFAGLLGLLNEGTIKKGQKVVLLHTGGLPAIFGYQGILSA